MKSTERGIRTARIVPVLIVTACSLLGCRERAAPVASASHPAPVASARAPAQVKVVGKSGVRSADARTARSILSTLKRIRTMRPERPTPAERASAKDSAKLVGRWRVVHTVYGTNGKKSHPRRPLVPTEWKLTADGRLHITGGMRIAARYLYTGDKLLISGFGPKQVYTIVKQTRDRLEILARISAGSVRIENTTVLARVGSKPAR